MLDAKRMGHSIYSFSRKKELFNKINSNCDYDNNGIDTEYIENKLKRMILSKNLLNFSLYLENTFNEIELKFMSDYDFVFTDLLEETKWKKGIDIFESYISKSK